MPNPVHLGGWQEEEEEDEGDQEINSGSTPKQGTGSGCWRALCHEVLFFFNCKVTWWLVHDLYFVRLYSVKYLLVELNYNDHLYSQWSITMIFSLLSFFFSVYILLSSTNIVALDDLRGEFSMDL